MIISNRLLRQISDPSLPKDKRAQLRCQLAKELEEVGNFEAAREAMGELWSRVGERPVLDGLDEATAAEVLLRAGVLTGWIGSTKQIEGAQETAKNFITESIPRFEALQNAEKVAEAQTEVGFCYWRQGSYNEARVWLQEALNRLLPDTSNEVRAVALIRLAIVERSAKRFHEALQIHLDSASFFQNIKNEALKGKFHYGFAFVLRNLGTAERRDDYIDRALIEYAAASYHFEQAGAHTRYRACVENNLGFLFGTIRRFAEAHEHLDRAQALFTSMKDAVHTAQVDDARARVLLAEGRTAEAEKLVRSAIQILERGGEQSLLAEALTTHGIVLARLGKYNVAHRALRHAAEVAENAGGAEAAGLAALTILEELGDHLPAASLSATYDRAAELLSRSGNQEHKDRLIAASRLVLFLIGEHPTPPTWKGFDFNKAVLRYEARIIKRALRETGGIVARAATLLGLKRQALDSMLKGSGRHRALAQMRAPVRHRKSSLMFRDEVDCPETRIVVVLHVEQQDAPEPVWAKLEEEGVGRDMLYRRGGARAAQWRRTVRRADLRLQTARHDRRRVDKADAGARASTAHAAHHVHRLRRRGRRLARWRYVVPAEFGCRRFDCRDGRTPSGAQEGEGIVRRFLAVVLVGLLLGAPGADAADSCSCDGRALCINGDAGAGLAAALKQPVTLEVRSGGTNKKISDELSRITGKRIVVLPSKPDEPVNVDIKSARPWDVLEMFSARGVVTIEGQDFSELQSLRRALAGGEKISVCINRAPLGRVVEELSGLSGRPLRVTSGDEKALVTLSAKAITLEGILSRLSARTRAQIGAK